jgi:hypothetical protein
MNKYVLCFVALLLVAGAYCQPYSGPFGLKMGLTLRQLENIDPDIVSKTDGTYSMKKVPTPHSSFESYLLTISPDTGLCKIMAIGKDIPDSDYGLALQSEYYTVKKALQKKYGKGKELDALLPDSIWDEEDDFLMGLLREERVLVSYWFSDTDDSVPQDISAIMLEAKALFSDVGYIRVHYEFANYKEYLDEMEDQEEDDQDDAF